MFAINNIPILKSFSKFIGSAASALKIPNIFKSFIPSKPSTNSNSSSNSAENSEPNSPENSEPNSPENSVPNSPTDYDFREYLEGLFSSQGAENEINRKYNSAEAAANRAFQSEEARIQRNWYEQMSNSAYQRAVGDMKAAGINPIMAYQQGGASSAGTGMAAGSAAQYNATGGDRVSDIMNGIANLIASISSAKGSAVSNAFKIFKMAGG